MFKCEKHGWHHLFTTCPACVEYTVSNSTVGTVHTYESLMAKVKELEEENKRLREKLYENK